MRLSAARSSPIGRIERGFGRTSAAAAAARLLCFFAIRLLQRSRDAGVPPAGPARPGFFCGDHMVAPVNGIASALQQMQAMAAQAAGGASPATSLAGSGAASAGSFASAMKASLDKISGDQQKALGEAHAFEIGAQNVSLNDVMVDMQKANIGFQFGLQVRNKLVSAYNEIMQMSV
ncbi:flagellar hook-basal body complex protein [Burkholderia pseudomallei 1710b]|nr:flagellar hook-basal body complex protein [Burkholderia pseudomallei 1710b]